MGYSFFRINKYLTQCDPRDVISFKKQIWVGIGKFEEVFFRSFSNEVIAKILSYISKNLNASNTKCFNSLFDEGEDCEILKAGSQGWQKGKIRINVTLEFIPDEPEVESPLDDIREEINQHN